MIKNIVVKGIKIYNKYRKPEAIVKLIEFKDNEFKVLFEGYFCYTCGIYDWIEDLKYILEDLGLKVKLVKIIEPQDINESYRIGIFKIEEIDKNE